MFGFEWKYYALHKYVKDILTSSINTAFTSTQVNTE